MSLKELVAQHQLQSRRGRSMTDTRTAIHVVSPQHDARKLLRQVILFVCRPRRSKHAEAVCTILRADLLQTLGRESQHLIPGDAFPFTMFTKQRCRDATLA